MKFSLCVVQSLSHMIPDRLDFLAVSTVRRIELYEPHPCMTRKTRRIYKFSAIAPYPQIEHREIDR